MFAPGGCEVTIVAASDVPSSTLPMKPVTLTSPLARAATDVPMPCSRRYGSPIEHRPGCCTWRGRRRRDNPCCFDGAEAGDGEVVAVGAEEGGLVLHPAGDIGIVISINRHSLGKAVGAGLVGLGPLKVAGGIVFGQKRVPCSGSGNRAGGSIFRGEGGVCLCLQAEVDRVGTGVDGKSGAAAQTPGRRDACLNPYQVAGGGVLCQKSRLAVAADAFRLVIGRLEGGLIGEGAGDVDVACAVEAQGLAGVLFASPSGLQDPKKLPGGLVLSQEDIRVPLGDERGGRKLRFQAELAGDVLIAVGRNSGGCEKIHLADLLRFYF